MPELFIAVMTFVVLGFLTGVVLGMFVSSEARRVEKSLSARAENIEQDVLASFLNVSADVSHLKGRLDVIESDIDVKIVSMIRPRGEA